MTDTIIREKIAQTSTTSTYRGRISTLLGSVLALGILGGAYVVVPHFMDSAKAGRPTRTASGDS